MLPDRFQSAGSNCWRVASLCSSSPSNAHSFPRHCGPARSPAPGRNSPRYPPTARTPEVCRRPVLQRRESWARRSVRWRIVAAVHEAPAGCTHTSPARSGSAGSRDIQFPRLAMYPSPACGYRTPCTSTLGFCRCGRETCVRPGLTRNSISSCVRSSSPQFPIHTRSFCLGGRWDERH